MYFNKPKFNNLNRFHVSIYRSLLFTRRRQYTSSARLFEGGVAGRLTPLLSLKNNPAEDVTLDKSIFQLSKCKCNIQVLLWLLCPSLYKRPVFIVCQETCNGIQLINVAKNMEWNLVVKELVFLHSVYEALHMHPEVCNGLGLPDLTGRHLGSAREKCRPIYLRRHKVINKMAIPGLKREGIPDSHMICLSPIDPAYRGEMNVTVP